MVHLTFATLLFMAASSQPSLQPSLKPSISWSEIGKGVQYSRIRLAHMVVHGDGILHVVRIDPKLAGIRVFSVSQQGGNNQTASQWSRQKNLLVAVNAGMYQEDFRTHVGYMRQNQHVNSPTWVSKYKSVLLLDPISLASSNSKYPLADVVDITGGKPTKFPHYNIVVQNLRLIRAPATNVWRQNKRSWSEAALALDNRGRILVLFSRTPMTMHDFNNKILRLDLGVVRAMHLEGGPEASLSIHGGGIDLDLSGSYETGFNENDNNRHQWPLPNIIGVESTLGEL